MKKYALFAAVLFCCSAVFADDDPLELSLTTAVAYYPESERKTGDTHFSGICGAFEGAQAAVTFDATYTVPFLQGSGDLTADNSAKFSCAFELSPISVMPSLSISFTPIAFLEFAVGGRAGTGWNLSEDLQGISEFNADKPEYKDINAFSGWYLNGWASACLMFDIGEVIEGDWTHVFATATYKAGYQKLTGTNETIWNWQAEYGMADGWIYEQEYMLGYQMPTKLSMIAVGTTLTGHYKSSDFGDYSSSYDGDYMTVDIWPMAALTLTEKDDIYLMVDFTSRRSFKEKYDDIAHEPLMTKSGREWIFYYLGLQWKHKF